MIGLTAKGQLYAALLAGGAVLGLGGGWALWHPRGRVVESYAPEVRQKDSSVVLERKPDATAKPRQIIPRGGVVERVVSVTVQPEPVPSVPRETPQPIESQRDTTVIQPCSCQPVTVDLSLVRMPDRSRRVVASARGGNVIGGVDIPVETAVPERVVRWSAGALRSFDGWGGFVGRTVGPVQVLAGALQTPKIAGFVGVGLRF